MALPREVKVKIADCCFDTPILLLGKVGENLATKVIIDASEWQEGSVATEVRTDASGNTQTNVYNLETLEQQFNV